MKREIYLDHAATTPVRSEVLEAMLPYFSKYYGNPSSLYAVAEQAKDAIEESRRKVSGVLNCRPDEVVFTSGGTESDNAAIKGVALAMRGHGNHIITTSIEHHAVLDSCNFLEEHLGFDVTYLPVNKLGLVETEDIAKNLTDKTILVSIMYANNEIGTIQPIKKIGEIVKSHAESLKRPVPFHTDAVQAAGYLDLDVDRLGVDLLSLSGHKIYGPKGIGVMYKRDNTPFVSYQSGGGQERSLRNGTENVPGIVGFGVAMEIASQNRVQESKNCSMIRDEVIRNLLELDAILGLNGHPSLRLPNNVNVLFKDIEGSMMVMALNRSGMSASTGSACSTGSPEPSHVMTALGVPRDMAWNSLRLTFGRENTLSDTKLINKKIYEAIKNLQSL